MKCILYMQTSEVGNATVRTGMTIFMNVPVARDDYTHQMRGM